MSGRILLLWVLLLTAGCHRYVPITVGEVAPDMAVRATLADRPTSPTVEGSVVELVNGGSGFILLPELRPGESGETIRILAPNVVGLERRELDGMRTGLLVAGTALAGVATILLIDGNPFANESRPGGGVVFMRLPMGVP